jgi:hypothetical protein
MLLKNSVTACRLNLADLILQGTVAARSHREGYQTLLGEILAGSRDPFVSKMRNSDQRASKFRRPRAIRVLQQNWRWAAGAAR